MSRLIGRFLVALTVVPTSHLWAQGESGGAPVVDTIVVTTQNVFGPNEARSNVLFRIANALHVTTRPAVIRNELLFRTGEPYDSARVAESLRNLRARGLFRDVQIDTVRTGGRLGVVVAAADAWTTSLVLNGRWTAGTFSWALGVRERNLLGLGARAGITYRDEPDRTALTLRAGYDRFAGTRFGWDALYDDLSDGEVGAWSLGIPFRAFTDRAALVAAGQAASQRVLQFRDGELFETFRRRLFWHTVQSALAVRASPGGYFRIAMAAQIKREEYFLSSTAEATVPDTVTGAIGLFTDLTHARFKVVTHYNGFAREEDLDLSSRVSVGAWAAPSVFGYERNGIGPLVVMQVGVDLGKHFARLQARANGLFTSAGLDSGQVWAGLTLATQAIPRNATVLHLEVGAQRGVAPGSEFDLGHGIGPRAFGPHAFTGNRSVWGSLEQRAFLIDEVLNLFGVGFAAFVDYGGAWFDDQPSRLGGNAGVGLRIGATRSTGQNVGRLDLAYRFGEGFQDKRWAVSIGRGFAF